MSQECEIQITHQGHVITSRPMAEMIISAPISRSFMLTVISVTFSCQNLFCEYTPWRLSPREFYDIFICHMFNCVKKYFLFSSYYKVVSVFQFFV